MPKVISKQVAVFSARASCQAEHYNEACEAVDLGEFKGITLLSNDRKQHEIPKGQFYQALAYSMSARLLPETEKALSRAVDILQPVTYPQDMSPGYGEADIRLVCTKFGTGFREVKHAFREYRDTRGATIPPAIRDMINCVSTIPVSTAECERGFNKMSHMFVSLCGPPVHLCQPVKYVKSWLAQNRRSADCLHGPQCKSQPGQPVPCGMLCELR